MTLLKVGVGFYVPTDEIVLLQAYPTRPARRDKQAAKEAGCYKDATTTGKRPETLRTLVHLRCGLIIGSPIGADALAKRPALETPVRHSTRQNNLEGAHIEDGQGNDQSNDQSALAAAPPKANAPRGRKFPDGEANPKARSNAEESDTGDAATPGDRSSDQSLFSRLLGRTDGPR